MANGQRAAPAVPLSPCLIHEKRVGEGVADRCDAPGGTASETHSAHCGAASHRSPPPEIHRSLCKKMKKKNWHFLFLYAICCGKEYDDMDSGP